MALIALWGWNNPACQVALLPKPCIRAVKYAGLWHGWAMFAPNPLRVNRRLVARVTFEDGLTEEWIPIGPSSSRVARTLFARCYYYENKALDGKHEFLYEPTSEYLARQAALEDGRRVVSVELFRSYSLVKPLPDGYSSTDAYSKKQITLIYRYAASANY